MFDCLCVLQCQADLLHHAPTPSLSHSLREIDSKETIGHSASTPESNKFPSEVLAGRAGAAAGAVRCAAARDSSAGIEGWRDG